MFVQPADYSVRQVLIDVRPDVASNLLRRCAAVLAERVTIARPVSAVSLVLARRLQQEEKEGRKQM